MDSIAATMVGMQAQSTRATIGIAMMKQQQQANQAVVDLLQQAVESAPAAGTGLVVDKRA